MMTVNEVSKRAKVSVRTLHYYDSIGLLTPDEVTEAKYRLYGDDTLQRLQCILLFKELEFPLKEIKSILNNPHFDVQRALDDQIALLKLKKEHLEQLIIAATDLKETGGNLMDFDTLQDRKTQEYKKEAKERWGQTAAYQESEKKQKNYSKDDFQQINENLMNQFVIFGTLKEHSIKSSEVQKQVQLLQQFITDHYYHCTKEILSGLGLMYVNDERFKTNIDHAGGAGTATFVCKAIEYYCSQS